MLPQIYPNNEEVWVREREPMNKVTNFIHLLPKSFTQRSDIINQQKISLQASYVKDNVQTCVGNLNNKTLKLKTRNLEIESVNSQKHAFGPLGFVTP